MPRTVSTAVLLAVAGTAAAVTYVVMQARLQAANDRADALQTVTTTTERTLLGPRTYTRYLQEGKRRLSAEQKLLTAKVRQPNAVTLVMDQSVLGLHSSGTVAAWYSVEYSFGYDLDPARYDVRATKDGIAIVIAPPKLVATPAVTGLRYKVLSGGWFTDEKDGALRLYAEAASKSKARGEELAKEPAIRALCEKQLAAALRGFLAQQPGVDLVPHVEVVYR